MIRADLLGELKDGAAGLVALSELLGSRRVGPKAVSAALGSTCEACANVEAAIVALAADVLTVVPATSGNQAADQAANEAASEIEAIFARALVSVKALGALVAASDLANGDAKTRLVLERAANEASAEVAAGLFVADMFSAAAAPRTVTIRVADVLGYGPSLPEGPGVVRATLDAPPGPVATTDARLLRALVEMSVQIVAIAGVTAPHVRVESWPAESARGAAIGAGEPRSGARIRVGVGPSVAGASGGAATNTSGGARRGTRGSSPPEGPALTVRRLPWSARVHVVAGAAAAMTGATVMIDPAGTGLSVVFA